MFRNIFRKKPTNIHLLHIGKTGGTSIIVMFKKFKSKKYNLIIHGHQFNLEQIPAGEQFVFFLRRPLDRFVSGFFSRKREGRPRYDVPYNEEEKFAFDVFETPNSLAEALSSEDESTKSNAIRAMNGIRHVNTHFSDKRLQSWNFICYGDIHYIS